VKGEAFTVKDHLRTPHTQKPTQIPINHESVHRIPHRYNKKELGQQG
jgi:hypothetical protein